MPQLDIFTYVNLSFFFFISFSFLYIIVSYCIFSVLTFAQKIRAFFNVFISDFISDIHILDYFTMLNNVKIFNQNIKIYNFKLDFFILDEDWNSAYQHFFDIFEPVYHSFPCVVLGNCIDV